jgi:hypothetical protein
MTADQVFSIANLLAMAGWLILIVAGRQRWAAPLVSGAILPLLFAIVYATLIVTHWTDPQTGSVKGGFSSLPSVAALFANPWLLLAGWIHYLAFDLFIGSWQVRDAARRGTSHWLVVPCLVLTFLFGPVGLLLYFCVRRSLSLDPSLGAR